MLPVARSEIDATARMREGLARFLAHHGIEGYHETLTVFWMKRLAARFAGTDPALTLDERIDAVIAGCVNDAPISEYYTRRDTRVGGGEARLGAAGSAGAGFLSALSAGTEARLHI